MNGWGTTIVGLTEAIEVFRSIQMRFDGDATYVCGPTVEYAVYHELGTSKMEARPFAKPAAERVQADLEGYASQMASAQGIDLTSEDGVVRATALAVEREMKQIVKKKDIWDTGALHGSITVEKVS